MPGQSPLLDRVRQGNAVTRRHDAQHLLGAWAEWVTHGCHVTSAIGYAPATIEARLREYGAIASGNFGPKTPIWFCGVIESRVHRSVMALRDAERLAVALKYLWTYQILRHGRSPVTDALRASEWSRGTGTSVRSYWRMLRRAENSVVRAIYDETP